MRKQWIIGLLAVGSSAVPAARADIQEDNITATQFLIANGTFDVSGTSLFSGPVYVEGATIFDHGNANFTPWSTMPDGAYWNVVLGDGFIMSGEPGSGPLGLDFDDLDQVLFWYPELHAFRAIEATSDSADELNVGAHSLAISTGAYASGPASIALGFLTKAYAADALALGKASEATGSRSIAIGKSADASGNDSIAIGMGSIASGNGSIALVRNSLADGDYGSAIGNLSTASSDYASAIGFQANGAAVSAIALGANASAVSYCQTALGPFNLVEPGQTVNAWESGDHLLTIGNGQSDTQRSNALVVYKNADAKFQGNLAVGGEIMLAQASGGVPMGDFGTENP